MKLIVLTLLFLAGPCLFAQEGPKAVLVDEFSSAKCDEILARIDNFSLQLHTDPTARGSVVVSGSNADLVKKLELEVLFTSSAIQSRMDSSRVQLLRGAEKGDAKMSFWLVPSGAQAPKSNAAWDLRLPRNSGPFPFFADGDSICLYSTVHKYLKEILDANPHARLNVVINAGTRREFLRLRRNTHDLYGRDYSANLRFFRGRSRYAETPREYWIVP